MPRLPRDKRLIVMLDDEENAALTEWADKLKESKSRIARQAITHYIGVLQHNQTRKETR